MSADEVARIRIGVTSPSAQTSATGGELPLRSLEQHAWELGSLLRSWASPSLALRGEASAVGEWLILAGGLDRVVIDTGRYDRSLVMCGRAGEYEDARSEAVGQVQTELTRLLYTWGAYETLRRAAAPSLGGGSPSDRQTREWLAREWKGPPPAHFACALAGMRGLCREGQFLDIAQYLRPTADYPEVVLGLRVAAELRHRLAHGDLVYTSPEGWGGRARHDRLLVRGGIRLLLFSLQMLLVCVMDGEGLVEERLDDADELIRVPMADALYGIGLEQPAC